MNRTKHLFMWPLLLAVLALALSMYLPGFAAAFGQAVTVSEARTMREDAWVVLEGKLNPAGRREHYRLVDATGEIVLDIENKILRGMPLHPGDAVIAVGRLDRSRDGMEVEVVALRKAGDNAAPVYQTVDKAMEMRDDDWVVMKGRLVEQVRRNKYFFADETGRVLVEIDRDVMRDIPFDPDRLVEIRGELDVDHDDGKREVEVDVKYIRSL